MASEISTAGIKLYYAVGTTQPTLASITTEIPDITSLPEIGSTPEGLECTPLSETVAKRYIPGLADPGSDFAITANDTTAFRTAWSGMITELSRAEAGSKIWLKIAIPNRDAFVISGVPNALGFNGAEPNAVNQLVGHFTPNTVVGWVATT